MNKDVIISKDKILDTINEEKSLRVNVTVSGVDVEVVLKIDDLIGKSEFNEIDLFEIEHELLRLLSLKYKDDYAY